MFTPTRIRIQIEFARGYKNESGYVWRTSLCYYRQQSMRHKAYELVAGQSRPQSQRLQKWTITTIAHKFEVARVRVLGADQKKSGLWGRDWRQEKGRP